MVDKGLIYHFIEKVEPLIQKKVRVGIYEPEEFNAIILNNIGLWMKLIG